MKNTIKILGLIALVAIIGCTVAACGGGGNPKSLAKETYQVFEKAMAAQGKQPSTMAFVLWSITKPEELKKLEAKVEALSESGQKAYEEELEKLLDGK